MCRESCLAHLKGVAQVEIVLGALPPANLNVTENDVQAWVFLAETFQPSQLRAKKAIPHECEFAHVGGWVPYYIVPQEGDPHVGSLDVDVAFDFQFISADKAQYDR